MSYVAVAALFLLALSCFSYAAFVKGYVLGWEERQRDMVLPRKIVDRTNKMLDDNETHSRHSAIDPKKPMWHG